jgi:hypothetical protein
MEEKLATRLGKGKISRFVQDDKVHPGEMLSKPALPSVAGLGLEAVDEVDHIVEAATGAGSDATSGDCDGQMGLARASTANEHDVALLSDEAAASKVVDERLVDRCASRTGSRRYPWRAATLQW